MTGRQSSVSESGGFARHTRSGPSRQIPEPAAGAARIHAGIALRIVCLFTPGFAFYFLPGDAQGMVSSLQRGQASGDFGFSYRRLRCFFYSSSHQQRIRFPQRIQKVKGDTDCEEYHYF